ncbi:MAG: hypothetical protein EB084_19075 [Proteobacteria bacterium]|nr:hypothetical protein [Pseudomonadota bacterium]
MLALQLISSPVAAAAAPVQLSLTPAPQISQTVSCTPVPSTTHRTTADATAPLPYAFQTTAAPDTSPTLSSAASPAVVRSAADAIARTDFAPMSPYVATVAEAFDATLNTPRVKTDPVFVTMPALFRDPLRVERNLSNGPDAAMLVILPGIGDDGSASVARQLEQVALDHGMNFTVVPNPWSDAWLEAHPRHLPGVLPVESRAVVDIVRHLSRENPAHYRHVSAVGYSYGGLLGAAALRDQQQAGAPPVINGTFTAVSPPMSFLDSVHQMDKMGNATLAPNSRLIATGLVYWSEIADQGYDSFIASPIARWRDDATEQFATRHYGPERILRGTLSQLDPPASAATFDEYTRTVLPHDPWFKGHATTVDAVAQGNRLDTLLGQVTGKGVPVMVLTSRDDLILTPDNVAQLSSLADDHAPDQLIEQYRYGGHMGVLFNPRIRDVIGGFATGTLAPEECSASEVSGAGPSGESHHATSASLSSAHNTRGL